MDKEIFLFFHKTISSGFMDSVMLFFTRTGWILWIPVLGYILYKTIKDRNYNTLLYLCFCLIIGIFLSDWLSFEIKNLFKRVRPCWIMDFREIIKCTTSYSFPSTHAANSLTATIILTMFVKNIFINQNIRKFFYFYIISVGIFICLSRIYLGVHWPTDVLAGAVFGVILGFLVYYSLLKVNSLKNFFYFSLIIISLFRIYFILHGPVDLSPDEAHYWEWSRRLDLSYYSKGPMIAYLIAISTGIFGDNPFGVRAFAVICSFLSSIFVYKIGKKLFSEKVGYIGGILFQLIPLFSTFGVIFTIDSPFILFWIISMYLFLSAVEGKKSYWPLLGLFIGFGLLTKYTMAFFYFCVFIYFLKKRENFSPATQANIINNFKNPMLYVCILISVMVFSPVIIWNFHHDWVTLKHTAGQAHIYDGLRISLKSFADFVGSQLIVVTPLIVIIGSYFLLKPKGLSLQPLNWWFLISFSFPILVFFLLKSIQGKVQANWAMTAYIPFLLIIAYAFEKKIFKKIIIFSIILTGFFTVLNYSLPYLQLQALDPSLRLKGWKELGIKVSEIKEELEKSGKVVIFSDRYQLSSELAFYVKGNPTVYCINLGRRMNQYDLWGSINSELKHDRKTHGIYVIYGKKNEPEPEVSSAFERCTPESFTAKQRGVKIRDYTIFKCYNFKGMIERKPESY